MSRYISDNVLDDGLFDENHFMQLAIDLSNESIANLRRELDQMKE